MQHTPDSEPAAQVLIKWYYGLSVDKSGRITFYKQGPSGKLEPVQDKQEL